jgi:hypothetical protein
MEDVFEKGNIVKNNKSKNDAVGYTVSISLITTINCYLTKWMMHKCQNRRKTVMLKEPLPYSRVLSLELCKQAISVYQDHATISLVAFHH